jgi:NAD(P)-dependent dehydrogenase (short-subunit alcohol dehydrogenase family)
MNRTPQHPLPSGFGAKTTAREVLAGRRLDGVVAIVTGGYAGVGLETTRALAEAGATVVVPARSAEKARAAVAGIPRVELASLELMDPASIDAFAAQFLASGRPLHALIDNAGIMRTPLTRDARGFESQLATNHLGHFQLTARLWPALRAARGARVVALSSRGHARNGVDFDDPHFTHRPYDPYVAYAQSKTANVLFAVALDARGRDEGVRAFAVHPGAIVTELIRSLSPEETASTLEMASRHPAGFKTPEQGAATSVWCATSPQLDGKGGVYCEDVDVAAIVAADATLPVGVRPWAIDPDLAERLWRLSEEWTGATLPSRP